MQTTQPTVKAPVLGYYVMGRYTSVAWFLTRPEAEAYCKHLNYRGGTVYRVEPK